MMGYIEDIRSQLTQMRDRRCHNDFYKLADTLLEHDELECLPHLLNVIKAYDKMARTLDGNAKTIENLRMRVPHA
jgi:hypothetical protein